MTTKKIAARQVKSRSKTQLNAAEYDLSQLTVLLTALLLMFAIINIFLYTVKF